MYLQLLSCGSSIIVVFNIVLKPGKRPWERGFVVKEFGDVGLCQVFNLMSKEHRSTRKKTMASEKRKNQKQTQPLHRDRAGIEPGEGERSHHCAISKMVVLVVVQLNH